MAQLISAESLSPLTPPLDSGEKLIWSSPSSYSSIFSNRLKSSLPVSDGVGQLFFTSKRIIWLCSSPSSSDSIKKGEGYSVFFSSILLHAVNKQQSKGSGVGPSLYLQIYNENIQDNEENENDNDDEDNEEGEDNDDEEEEVGEKKEEGKGGAENEKKKSKEKKIERVPFDKADEWKLVLIESGDNNNNNNSSSTSLSSSKTSEMDKVYDFMCELMRDNPLGSEELIEGADDLDDDLLFPAIANALGAQEGDINDEEEEEEEKEEELEEEEEEKMKGKDE